jgi:predicted DNA-binding transcriptional regulator AlpA
VTKELLSERDLDEAGFFTKRHRERLIKAGKFPKPVRFGDSNNSKRFYTRESIEAYKALAASAEATAA